MNPAFLVNELNPLDRTTVDGRPLGYVPSTIESASGVDPSIAKAGMHTSPSRYDLRTQGRVTPVKDQGALGTCWAFAATGSLESCLLPAQLRDFSEDNMACTAGFSVPGGAYDGGGQIYMSTAYLVRWGGPVLESDDAYGDGTTPAGLTARRHVQDVSWLPTRGSWSDNSALKSAVETYGGTVVSMSWQGSSNGSPYYNAATHAYYYDGSAFTNHEVLVVGWDDDYSAANFATRPAGDGAFIVKNSWGNGWGDGGYFYVSYYDEAFGRQDYMAAFNDAESPVNYATVYQYDPLGDVTDLGYPSSDTAWMANKFPASSDSSIQAVGFYAEAPDTAYQVYTGSGLASLTLQTSGTCTSMGFHTVKLPSGVPITAGHDFVVAVKVTTPDYDYPVALEYPWQGYSDNATAQPGQSYISDDGADWMDATRLGDPDEWNDPAFWNCNVCLKAYAAESQQQTDDDIPGSPLSGGSVSGSLTANADNDDVGWLHLDAKYGMQATLTGDPATDFNLYLFPPTATSLSPDHAGYLVRSVLSGYPDTATCWSAAGGSYYVDVNRFSGSGSYTLTYSLLGPDLTAPTTDISPAPVSSWQPTHVTETLIANDETGGSGVDYTEYDLDGAGYRRGDSVTISTTGPHTLVYRSVDKAGNTESRHSVTVNVDETAPVTVANGLTAQGWAAPGAHVTLVASDAGSGVAYTEYSLDGAGYERGTSVTVPEGQHTLSYRSADNAGHLETATTVTVKTDGAGPTSALAAQPPSGWVNHDVSLNVQASDTESGVAGVQCRLDGGSWSTCANPIIVSSEGQTVVGYRAVDNVGNVGAAQSCTVRIDRTGPRTSASRMSARKGRKATFRFKVTDQTATASVAIKIFKSGGLKKTLFPGRRACDRVQSYAWKRCTLAKGTYTWRVLATDEAGNAQTRVIAGKLTVR